MKLVICLLTIAVHISSVLSGCVKFKHCTRSNADSVSATVHNANHSETVHGVASGEEYHRFEIDSFDFVKLEMIAQKTDYNDTENIILHIEDIFPVKNPDICTSIPASPTPGGCTAGGCCKFSLNARIHYDDPDNKNSYYVHMKARTNHRDENGTNLFWICEQEFHVVDLQIATDSELSVDNSTDDYPLVQGYGDECGSCGDYSGVAGCITSHYLYDHENYESGLRCTTTIRAAYTDYPYNTNTNSEIQLYEWDFDLERKSWWGWCSYDYLRIRDGSSSSSAKIGDYCDDDMPYKISSSGPNMYLFFKTDSSVQDEGYKLLWTAGAACGESGVDGNYYAATGCLVSRYWHDNSYYPDNYDSSTYIEVPSGRIQIYILEMDVEYSAGCYYDYVQFDFGWGACGARCGSGGSEVETCPYYWSHSNHVTVHFHTDYGVGGRGWKLMWTQVDW